jgi:uncharacterized protein
MTELRLRTSDGLSLEAEWEEPDAPRAAVILCHPHPQMGGTMNAPLLLALRDHLLDKGWAVLRFNYRGIGTSEGSTGIGDAELQDVRAAIDEVAGHLPQLPRALVGWSFGAAVAIRVSSGRDDLLTCIGIAPAIKPKPGITAGVPPAADIDLRVPTHLIVGINDDLVDPDDCEQWALEAGASCEVMKGANHFFWAKYDKLVSYVATLLDTELERGQS